MTTEDVKPEAPPTREDVIAQVMRDSRSLMIDAKMTMLEAEVQWHMLLETIWARHDGKVPIIIKYLGNVTCTLIKRYGRSRGPVIPRVH